MNKILNVCLGILMVMLIVTIIGGIVILKNNEDYGTVEGTIIEKEHKSAWTQYLYFGRFYISPVYHPESWKIEIKKKIEDKEKTRWIEVKEDTYNNVNIGDYYKGNNCV